MSSLYEPTIYRVNIIKTALNESMEGRYKFTYDSTSEKIVRSSGNGFVNDARDRKNLIIPYTPNEQVIKCMISQNCLLFPQNFFSSPHWGSVAMFVNVGYVCVYERSSIERHINGADVYNIVEDGIWTDPHVKPYEEWKDEAVTVVRFNMIAESRLSWFSLRRNTEFLSPFRMYTRTPVIPDLEI